MVHPVHGPGEGTGIDLYLHGFGFRSDTGELQGVPETTDPQSAEFGAGAVVGGRMSREETPQGLGGGGEVDRIVGAAGLESLARGGQGEFGAFASEPVPSHLHPEA